MRRKVARDLRIEDADEIGRLNMDRALASAPDLRSAMWQKEARSAEREIDTYLTPDPRAPQKRMKSSL